MIPVSNRSGIFRSLAGLAVPLLTTAVLHSAASMAKLYWVGRFGRNALASVTISETIALLLFPLLIGLSTSTSAIVARAAGAADDHAVARTAIQSILLAVILGSVSTFIGRLFSESLLSMFGADAQVVTAGDRYLDVLLLGVLPLFVMFMANAVLNATGRAVEPMLASAIVSAITLVLPPFLMLGKGFFPAMGLIGAAWATVVADLIGAVLSLWMLFRHYESFKIHKGHWRPDFRLMGRVLRIGAAGFGQLFLRILAGAMMMRIVASGGTAAIAAYGIGLRLDALILTPSFALGGAAATLVGISLGARNPDRARRAAWSAVISNLAVIAPMIVVVIACAPLIAARFNGEAPVISMTSAYLRIVWPAHFFTAASITLGRAMQGAGDMISSMLVTIAGLWLLQIPLAILLAFAWKAGSSALWSAIAVAAMFQGITMAVFFERGRWKRTVV